jgi:hypothetical protein
MTDFNGGQRIELGAGVCRRMLVDVVLSTEARGRKENLHASTVSMCRDSLWFSRYTDLFDTISRIVALAFDEVSSGSTATIAVRTATSSAASTTSALSHVRTELI